MTLPPDEVRLRHIRDAAETALRFAARRNRADLDTDEMLRLALTKLVEIVGEAARHLGLTSAASDSATFKLSRGHPGPVVAAWFTLSMSDNFIVHGERPRPRALILGFESDVADRLGVLFPTSQAVEDLTEIHQPEWDALVTSADVPFDLARPIYVIAFGNQFGMCAAQPDTGQQVPVEYCSQPGTRAQELEVPADLPPHLSHLVTKDLVRRARLKPENPVLRTVPHANLASAIRSPVLTLPHESCPETVSPFLRTREPRVLAGRLPHVGTKAETWAIGPVPDPVPWVRAALIEWHDRDPSRFPIDLSWQSDPEWRSAGELRALDELQAFSVERRAIEAELDGRERELDQKLEAERQRAERGPRKLLTSTGPELVDAVAEALRTLGFIVEERDPQHDPGDGLEDLLVHDPALSGWLALVEVKGHKGGAKATALQKIARFILRRIKEGHTEPNRRWYVVNQFLGQDPATRQPAIPNDEDVQTFADDGGLIVDTAHLYLLIRDVGQKAVSADAARTTLREQTGRFRRPEPRRPLFEAT